ncbi:hypothetical protein GUJ93_ZPchr0004g38238 [Zizania palustris]|uniref:Uncharacterized protein n=1 Tax=Zizania palustris TaxID=103762 RepID=A0A8J5VYN9_ZIZPA|nr:hypothetical protein GUJ93_ZPchr0004g38238 [Zizania palustris]
MLPRPSPPSPDVAPFGVALPFPTVFQRRPVWHHPALLHCFFRRHCRLAQSLLSASPRPSPPPLSASPPLDNPPA